jgi:hypothetical protein
VPHTCRKSVSAHLIEAFRELHIERREQVAVRIQGRGDRGVTEAGLDRLGMRSFGDRQRDCRVPQVVERRRTGDAGPLDGGAQYR